MSLLIVFATVEGQTGKIARFAEDQIRNRGLEVVLVDTGDLAKPISFEGVDKVILAASVHERRHPKSFEIFLTAHQQELAKRDTLLLSVSLSAAFPEGIEEAKEYVTEMKMRTGLVPDVEALVPGAVRTNRYDYYAMQVLRHVVLRGRDFDPTENEHEFTDWRALEVELSSFLGEEVNNLLAG